MNFCLNNECAGCLTDKDCEYTLVSSAYCATGFKECRANECNSNADCPISNRRCTS